MGPMVPEPWSVKRVRRENHDTVTLELESVRSEVNCSFAPGQFNMLYLFGLGEVPISVSGSAAASRRLTHTIRAVGPITTAMSRLKAGVVVGVRGPFGSHWPVDSCEGGDIVIFAGGIGIAPLRAVVYTLLRRRNAYRRIALLCGARTPGDLLYVKELEKWRDRSGVDVQVTVDRATRDWRGNVGVVTTLLPRIDFDADRTTAMICGPEVMMRFAVRALQKRGLTGGRIFLSIERNMKCAVGFCGHCQLGPTFICKDGPVFSYDRIKDWIEAREI